jgi:hypothetical protein
LKAAPKSRSISTSPKCGCKLTYVLIVADTFGLDARYTVKKTGSTVFSWSVTRPETASTVKAV